MSQLFYDHRWCILHGIGRFATEVRKRLEGFVDIPLTGYPTQPLDAFRLAASLQRSKATAFFSPGFNVPAWSRCPVIATVHDLIHVHFADERTSAKLAYYRFIQRPVVRRAPVTLTVSEYSRRQIIQWYGVPESRVVSVGNGISEDFGDEGEAFRSERPYFLYVGNDRPHKNVQTLLSAMSQVIQDHDVTLMLVTRRTASLDQKISAAGLQDHVTTVSGVDDRALAMRYRGALGLVMPSHYEGFGLPVLEAMACGCPVIGANCTSIPEVLDGAGLLFDPNDVDALADKMRSLSTDASLRADLRARGLARASAFTWDSVASKIRETIAPYLS